MAFAFEGYTTAEFAGDTFSCAGGLAPDLTAYIPALLPNTTVIASPIVRNVLTNPGPDCVVDLGRFAWRVGQRQLFRSPCLHKLGHHRSAADALVYLLHTPCQVPS